MPKIKMNNLTKSIALGAIAGTAAFAVTSAKNMKHRKTNALKKKVGKTAKTVGTMISDIAYMMG